MIAKRRGPNRSIVLGSTGTFSIVIGFPRMRPRIISYAAHRWRSLRVALPARSDSARSEATNGPLVVAGFFRTASGIGASARACADALEAYGNRPIRCDISGAFHQTDLAEEPRLATFPDSPTGTLILHANAPETVKALTTLGLTGRKRHWRVIGYWAWELEHLPPHWAREAAHLSEIWTPSDFTSHAVRGSVQIPVTTVPHAVTPPKPVPMSALQAPVPAEATLVLAMADGRSSLVRKNLTGAIKTFKQALGGREDCWLCLKTRNLSAHPQSAKHLHDAIGGHPRIKVIDASLSSEDRWSLMARADILLSLHRSEGFGLTLAEAMSLGKPVVATAWSGNLDFMTDTTSCLVPARLIPVHDETGIYPSDRQYRWADPDLDIAATHLTQLADQPGLRTLIGGKACQAIKATLNGRAYLDALAPETPRNTGPE